MSSPATTTARASSTRRSRRSRSAPRTSRTTPRRSTRSPTYYWDKAYRDFTLKEAEKRDYVDKGLEAVDKALQIKPDYMEALVYKGLLLRLQANLEKDPAKQQAADQGSRRAPRQGEGTAQAEGRRRQLARTAAAHAAFSTTGWIEGRQALA